LIFVRISGIAKGAQLEAIKTKQSCHGEALNQ
jgi:hypothetical protein